MTSGWPDALDAFGSHLEVQTALVEQGRYDEVVPFAQPADLPDMPKELVLRALELVDRARDLTDLAGAIRDDTAQRLARSRHTAFSRSAATAYVDQQA